MTDDFSQTLLPLREERACHRPYMVLPAAARCGDHHRARPRSRRRNSRRATRSWGHLLLIVALASSFIAVAILTNDGRHEEVVSTPIVQVDDESAVLVVSTSAYAWGCGASGSTQAGTPVRWGVVATDPRVIPLGTELEIEGFPGTTFIAEDTGPAVTGSEVDIYWPDGCESALRYGRQTRTLRFI